MVKSWHWFHLHTCFLLWLLKFTLWLYMHFLVLFQKGMLGYYKMPACLCQDLFPRFLLISIYFYLLEISFYGSYSKSFLIPLSSEMLSRHISDIDPDSFYSDFFSWSQCFDFFVIWLLYAIFLIYKNQSLILEKIFS